MTTNSEKYDKIKHKIDEDHISPSPETRERLVKVETNQKNYMEQNTKEHKEIKELILGIKNDVKDALDNKANKWVEDAIKWVAYTVIGAVILGVIGFVYFN